MLTAMANGAKAGVQILVMLGVVLVGIAGAEKAYEVVEERVEKRKAKKAEKKADGYDSVAARRAAAA